MPVVAMAMLCANASAQGTTEEFGQNRVQYKKFNWSYFESDHFVTYFYLGGQDIGKYTIIFAEKSIADIEKELEFHLNKRVEIMVYNNLSELNQTNIGIGQEINNTGGVTKIIQNKIFIYYNGDHQQLERQIRQGIAQVMINHMVFGTTFAEVLQNAVLLNLPDWFTLGLASYTAENWNSDMEDQLRDGILAGKYKKLNKLQGDDVRFVGHAFWHYVEQKYGKSAASNLLYLTRINRSLESGCLFVLGGSVKNIYKEWYAEQKANYFEQKATRILPTDSMRVKKRPMIDKAHYQVKLNDDGNHIAYSTNILGLCKVFVLDKDQHKQTRILKIGHKTTTQVTDKQYPLLAWSPDKKNLAVIYNKNDKLRLLMYDIEKKKKTKSFITKFQQIHDFRFTNDPNMLIMAGVNKGQSDLYTYQVNNTTTFQLTDDYFDDLDVAYVDADGRRGILFKSNRPTTALRNEKLDTTLLKSNYDIFFYDLAHRKSELTRVTNTEFINERSPEQYDSINISYLSDANGITNRYVGRFESVSAGRDTVVFFKDSMVTNPTWNLDSLQKLPNNGIDSIHRIEKIIDVVKGYSITNSAESILENDISTKAKKSISMYRQKGRYRFYLDPLQDPPVAMEAPNTPYQTHYLKRMEKEKADRMPKKVDSTAVKRDGEADTFIVSKDYYFQSDFNTSPEINVARAVGGGIAAEAPVKVFMVTHILPYRVKFQTDYIVTQADNSLVETRYQQFRPGSAVFSNPDLGAMIKLGISDLFEDYKIYGGFRLPFDLKGSEYFLAYEDLKKRLDKKVLYYRKVDQQEFSNDEILPFLNNSAGALSPGRPPNLPVIAKLKTNYFEFRLKYPFDVTKSIRGYLSYRNDNFVFSANEAFTLALPNYNENWVFAKLEYVQDNTLKVAKNIYNGIRFKAWAEIHKKFTIQTDTVLNNLKLPLPHFGNEYFGIFGFDFRYYQKIHRTLTWCNRFSTGTSYGNNKLVYYLGGVDSWIGAQFNQETPVNQNAGYAYQTTATNLRGFDQNIRNGNSYALFNSEIRWPIFSYLVNSHIRSQFLRDFMIVGFTDIGTAWEGLNPFSNSNPLFVDHIGSGSVTVNVQYYRNPIVFGYGVGVRSTILGYYARFDVAWGRDSGQKIGPKLYFSLSTDF